MYSITAVHNPPIDEVTYILSEEGKRGCLLIDPYDISRIEVKIGEFGRPEWLLLTHEHYDHIAAVNQLVEKYHCKVAASKVCAEQIQDPRKNMSAYYDALMELHDTALEKRTQLYSIDTVNFMFEGSAVFQWKDLTFELVEVRGHSPGSICIRFENNVFTGDVLLRDTEVITRFPGGSKKEYLKITKPYLFSLPPDLQVYPGHGDPFVLGESIYLYPKE